MKTWAVLAAKHATLTSGVSFSAMPGLGAASLDGFALGALLAGACVAALNSPRRGLGGPGLSLPVRTSRRQAVRPRAGRRPVAGVRSGPGQPDAQPGQRSLASAPLSPVLARPSFLAAPAALPERTGRPDGPEPESAPGRLEAAFGGSGFPAPAEPVSPSGPTWLPRQAERPEDSRPYALPAPAARSDVIRPGLVPALAGAPAIRRLSRFRRRIDSMLVELLGDDPDDDKQSPLAEPDEGFWGPERADGGPTTGYRSKHRLTDPTMEPRRPDGQRSMPRHAAPPAGFSARLTGRYAAHAAG